MRNYDNIAALRRRLFKVLNDRGLMAYRSDIVIDYTNGRETSTTVLNPNELSYLTANIETGGYDWVKTGVNADFDPTDTHEERNKIRRRIISHFIEMGAENSGKADMTFIYKVVKHFWHKQFNNMTVKELNKVAGLLKTKWLPWYYKKKGQDASFTILNVKLDVEKKQQSPNLLTT